MRLIKQIATIISMMLFGAMSSALATHVPLYNGCRWWSAVEHIQYNYSNLDTLRIPRSIWVSELNAARIAWNGHSRFTLYEAASNPHTIYAGSINGAYAITTWTCLAGYLQDADIKFNNTIRWYTDGQRWPDFRSIAIHEFGHIVSLKDTSKLSGSYYCYEYTVMYDCGPRISRSLFNEDKSWLRSIYGT